MTWHKSGVSQADSQRDFYECERDTRASAWSFSGGLQGAGEAQAFYGRCMTAKGYHLSNGSPNPSWDTTGKVYPPDAMVLCVFPDRPGSTNIQAKQCLSGRGTIAGPAPVISTAQRDATGRTYADSDRAMCMFPNLQAPVNLQAKACAQGGGTITGPAT